MFSTRNRICASVSWAIFLPSSITTWSSTVAVMREITDARAKNKVVIVPDLMVAP
jgi:hypothetical protein